VIIKICGITRAEDAALAVALGASALGFVFWPGSPRAIDPHRARAIAASLPPFVTAVGVFVNQPAGFINSVSNLVGLGVVQLHGDEDPAYAAAVKRPVLKAVNLPADSAAIDRWSERTMLLVDAHDPVRRGGTGTTADWGLAAPLARQRPIMLAGGLTPDNVADAIAWVQPFGIDVSSGVEQAPGIKDRHRMMALFEQLRDTATTSRTGRAG
jgi:phosphoribosylanthranilate isomerase